MISSRSWLGWRLPTLLCVTLFAPPEGVRSASGQDSTVEATAADGVAASEAPPSVVEAEVASDTGGQGPSSEQAAPAPLQFSFREQQWIDVLDWFAKQADLSLVVNELPPGEFTYSDTRGYSPAEALDLLNGVLGTRGFALVRRERMLICANLSQGIPEGLVPRVALEQLDQRGQFELVEVLFPLGKRPAAGVVEEITPLLGKYGKATPLPQTGQLLVTTTAGTMRAVSAIISSIPEPQPAPPKPKDPPPPGPELVTYAAGELDLGGTVEMLKAMLGDATITVDARAKQINIYAPPKQQAVAKQMLDQLLQSHGSDLKPRLELYDVRAESSATVLQQLRLVVPNATLSLDSQATRLIAFAEPSEQAAIVAAMEKLEAGGPTTSAIPNIYSLRHADPATAAKVLKEIFPRATITVDPATQRLVLLGSLSEQAAARQFLEQWEREPSNRPEVRYYPLEPARADAAQSLLQSLLPGLKLTYDRESRQLMVVAASGDQARAQELLDTLAQESPAVVPRILRAYPVTVHERTHFLRHYTQLDPELVGVRPLEGAQSNELLFLATADEHERLGRLLTEVRQTFPEPQRELRFFAADDALRNRFQNLRGQLAPQLGEIQILDNVDDPRLAILATPDQHRQIEALLAELNRNLPHVAEQLRVFTVTPTQRTRFRSLQPELGSSLKSIRVLEETRPDELVVWGTPEQLAELDKLLPTLQSPAAADRQQQLIAYTLRQGDPATVEKVLRELYPDLKIIVDADSRRVMVWATADQHAPVAQAIEQLDAPGGNGKNRMAYYPLGDLNARELEPLLQSLVPKMSLVTDRSSNSIVAWGAERDHELLARTVADFEQQQAKKAKAVVSYPCGTAPADRVRRLLLEVVPNTRIVSDEAARKVIVWGSPDEHRAVEQALREVTRATDLGEALLRVYPLENIASSSAQQLLAEIAPTAEINVSDSGKQLLVWTTQAQHDLIAKALQEVASGAPVLVVKSYSMANVEPNQARELIRGAVPDAQFLTPQEPRSLLIRASAAAHETIRLALAELEQAVAAPEPQQVVVYPLGEIPPATITSLLAPELLSGLTVLPDAVRRALIVRGPADRQTELQQAIDALVNRLPAEKKRETHVYRLTHASPTALNAALAPLLPTATFSVDTEARSLLVTAHAEDHLQVAEVVQQLDQPQTAQRQTRVYALGARDFFGLRSALQELVPNAVVASDRSSRMLLVTASELDQQRVSEVMEQLALHGDANRSSKIYRLANVDAEAAENAIEALLPNAVVHGDNDTRSLLVTADDRDQARAAEVIVQLNHELADDLQTRAYPLSSADVRSARDSLETLLPAATIAADFGNRTLVVTCPAADQARAAEAIAQLDRPNAAATQTQVYHLQYGDVDAAKDALAELLPRGSVSADRKNRALIVTGSTQELARAQAAVTQLDIARQDPTETRVYSLQRGDAAAVQRALQSLLPNAVFANDPAQRALLATATPAEHQRIAAAVEEMDRRNPDEPVLQAYSVSQANVVSVLNSLKSMYDRNPQVALTADEINQSILAKAPPLEQRTIAQVVSQLENGAAGGTQRLLTVYPIQTTKGDVLLTTLQKLFEKQQPAVELSLNNDTQQIVAVATPAQHRLLADAVQQIQRDPIEVEVFPLNQADPFTIELAIDRLYAGETSKPIANGDTATQQLFVRGTREQLAAVRELLAKMGELPEEAGPQPGVRTIPFRGSVPSALEQLQQVWPQLRANPLRVMQPTGDTTLPGQGPRIETSEPGAGSPSLQRPAQDNPANPDTTPPDAEGASQPLATETQIVAAPAASESQAAAPVNTTPADGVPAADSASASPTGGDGQAAGIPLLILPGSGTITLFSDDEAALNQAETLLRSLARQSLTDASSGNFAVYTLRNAGARSVAKLLTDLFEQMPVTTRATVGRVSMVPDDRLNAVVVHGRPADRAVIAELLRVLDSANVPDSLANARPKIVSVEYLEAPRVMDVLQGVYATQLKSGGNRPEIEIPKGLSSEVATLLQQINASNSGPLLTLEVDEVTNSIVILAPPQLSDEVAALVERLDRNAQDNDARDIGIVTLRGTNVKQLQPALQQLLRNRRRN